MCKTHSRRKSKKKKTENFLEHRLQGLNFGPEPDRLLVRNFFDEKINKKKGKHLKSQLQPIVRGSVNTDMFILENQDCKPGLICPAQFHSAVLHSFWLGSHSFPRSMFEKLHNTSHNHARTKSNQTTHATINVKERVRIYQPVLLSPLHHWRTSNYL